MTITPTLYRIRIANYLYNPKNTKKQKSTFNTYHRDNNNTYIYLTLLAMLFLEIYTIGAFLHLRDISNDSKNTKLCFYMSLSVDRK